MNSEKEEIIKRINNNEIIALPTDTVFAMVAKLNKKNISKINKLKNRDVDQPVQILFPSLREATIAFEEDYFVMNYLSNNFKDKTSYLLKAKDEFNNQYLTKGYNRKVLIRIPKGKIVDILKETGPLLATSTNLHNEKPMVDNDEIRKKFNIFVSKEKQINNESSKIISIINSEIEEIR